MTDDRVRTSKNGCTEHPPPRRLDLAVYRRDVVDRGLSVGPPVYRRPDIDTQTLQNPVHGWVL